jgi:FkbM family methyltransferase
MPLVSCAQNQEDIMLWRALRHVRDGFYIDVGAAAPDDLSVTKVFYDMGWCGINVEPSATYFAALSKARPRDINLRLGISREAGALTFYHVVGTGLSTLDRKIAMDHRTRGGWDVVEETVETLSLADVCRRYRRDGPIHFLKIDVEGTEGDVLAGADFAAFRPWVVLIEATLPLSQHESYAEWEATLTSQGYSFVWFDGLNRFYLSEEVKVELEPFFRVQPNIFDDFVPIPELVRRAERTEQGLQAARAEIMQTARIAAETLQRAAQAGEQSADAVRRVVETIQQTTAITAQHSALLIESQRQHIESQRQHIESQRQNVQSQQQNSELARHRDALARQLVEVRAQQDALAEANEHLRAMLGEAEDRGRRSEEFLRQMHRSTSWRVTTPLRVLRRLCPGASNSVARSSSMKQAARRAFYRGGQVLLWFPGGHRCIWLARIIAPRPTEWLALRYRAYAHSAAEPRAEPVPDLAPQPAQVTVIPVSEVDLSQEEVRVRSHFRFNKPEAVASVSCGTIL